MNMMRGNEFVLRYDLYDKSRSSSFTGLWKNEAFLDVTIVCDDDQIDAHKLVLSAASPLFQKILLRNQSVPGRPLLYLQGTKRKDIELLLEFVYSGNVNIPAAELERFMTLANRLEVEGLFGDMSETINIPSSSKIDSDAVEFDNLFNKTKSEDLKDTWKSNAIIEDTNGELPTEKTTFDVRESTSEDLKDVFPNDEYDSIVQETIIKSEDGFKCRECPYAGKRCHVKEHVEKHIHGFEFQCSECERTFSRKYSLRKHRMLHSKRG